MRGLRGILLRSRGSLLHQSEACAWSAIAARNCGPSHQCSEDDFINLKNPSLGQVKARDVWTAAVRDSQLRSAPAAHAASAWGSQLSARLYADGAGEHGRARRDVTRHYAHGEEWTDPYRCLRFHVMDASSDHVCLPSLRSVKVCNLVSFDTQKDH